MGPAFTKKLSNPSKQEPVIEITIGSCVATLYTLLEFQKSTCSSGFRAGVVSGLM